MSARRVRVRPPEERAAEVMVLRDSGRIVNERDATIGELIGKMFHADVGGSSLAATALSSLGEELWLLGFLLGQSDVDNETLSRHAIRLAQRAEAVAELVARAEAAPESAPRAVNETR